MTTESLANNNSIIAGMEEAPEIPNENEGQSLEGNEGDGVDKVFYVEAILGKRICNGIVQYRIRWTGYAEEDDTWEYIDNCHCPELIQQFEEENKDLVLEHFETEEMIALRKKNKRKRNAGNNGPAYKQRGRKSKLDKSASNESPPSVVENEGGETDNSNEEGENEEQGDGEWIPFEEKEHYRLEKEGIIVTQIIGMRQMETNQKLMALVNYNDDSTAEYIPVEELRKYLAGKELLLDFFLARIQMI